MNTLSPLIEALPLEAEIARLRQVQRDGRPDVALAGALRWLDEFPENRDLLLLVASCQRHLARVEQALATLDRLAALQPRFSLAHQERGLCHVARKDAPAAIAALLRAVAINPALPMAWRMLEGVYRLTGQVAEAETAAAHVATLRTLPAEVVRATALYADGDLGAAEALIRAFLLSRGDHPEAMRLLAKIGMAHEVHDDAETLLAAVVAMQPDHHAARFEYAQVLCHRHKHAEAREALAPLLARDPGNFDYRTLASTIAVGLGEQEVAITLYRELLAGLPEQAPDPLDGPALAVTRADLHLWIGHALKTLGRLDEAVAAYRQAIATRPDFGDAWWSLANLKTYRFEPTDLAAMRQAEQAASTAETDRIHLAFALGKALEDAGDAAGAWVSYARGNALKRGASPYRPEAIETNTAEQKRVCTPVFFAERSGWGSPDPAPIFVVGLPRAGSTLIEQILASHSQVEGTQELPHVHRYAGEFQGRDPDPADPRYPGALADLSREQARALGERFLAETRAYRQLGRARFIDKMPNNFRHIGLIHLILPEATVIDARREPIACCVSNLRQLFASGQEFTYAAADIARYYRTYLELMRHWDAVLPGKVIRVVNEDLIADPEGQIRRLLAACGLPFEEGCLAFHENRRAVRTPSSEQVRRPINADGLDAWRQFEPWLGELKAALGDALESWRT